MRKVNEMVGGEAEDATYSWTQEAIALFDCMVELNKPFVGGQLLSGLAMLEMRYRLGAFADYFDYLGSERAFHLDDPRSASEE